MPDNPPALPPGLRVPLNPIEGATPAQRELAAAAKPQTPISALEQRMYQVFELIERHINADVSGRYGALLQDIAEDQVYDGIPYLGLLRSPAAVQWFPTEGGLVRYWLTQWDLWAQLRAGETPEELTLAGLPQQWRDDADVNDENVLQGILIDSLHMGWATWIALSGEPFGYLPGSHESDVILSEPAKTLLLLQQSTILLEGHLLHLLLPNHDSGFQSMLACVCECLREAAVIREHGGP